MKGGIHVFRNESSCCEVNGLNGTVESMCPTATLGLIGYSLHSEGK